VDAVLTRYAGPGHLKLTLVVLANHANINTGECWPAYEMIAAQISATKRTAIRNVNELQDEGFVELVERGGFRTVNGKRRYVSNLYRVSLATLKCWPKIKPKKRGGPVDGFAHSDTHDTVPVPPMTPCDGDTHDTLTVTSEPSLEEPSLRTVLLEARQADALEAFTVCRAQRESFKAERSEKRRQEMKENDNDLCHESLVSR